MQAAPYARVVRWLSLSTLLCALACKSGGGEKSEESKESTSSAETSQAKGKTEKASATPAPGKPAAGIPAPDNVAEPPKEAEHTESGLVSLVLNAGEGKEHPDAWDRVKVHYTGWTKDGKMFDSSVTRGKPAQFGLGRVIKGWTEGLQLMVQGEKRRFWIPGNLAYGDTPRRPGAPAGQLTFDVELLEIIDVPPPPPPPETPKDVAAAPSDAKKTKSGLAYKVLRKGTGKVHPKPTDRVKVHYAGWTPDGKMFDSSIPRGRPSSFGVSRVISGWTEGLQLMVEGEKTRLWIPSDLAYGDKPKRRGAPAGALVFDVELLEILAPPKPRPSPATPPAAKKQAPAEKK